jgi:hypothetical protein
MFSVDSTTVDVGAKITINSYWMVTGAVDDVDVAAQVISAIWAPKRSAMDVRREFTT